VTTLLQVSDPHFGTEVPAVEHALLEFALKQRPDVLVLSGDITQRARRRQFDAARRFVDRVAAPATIAIPGNHDIPLFNVFARIFTPYGGYRRVFGCDLEPALDLPRLLVVGVNTTRPRRHVDGEVSQAQVARVSSRLRAATASQLRVVVVHQPVLAVRDEDTSNLLHGRLEAVPAWAEAGADLIMGGHIHLPYVRSLAPAYRELRREVWTVQAGTAVSSRIRENVPNSVNVVRCERAATPRQCRVERWDFSPVSGTFEQRARHELCFSDEPRRG
jgi:3',5'-cyclic AMP phosphodiesterase CpdA